MVRLRRSCILWNPLIVLDGNAGENGAFNFSRHALQLFGESLRVHTENIGLFTFIPETGAVSSSPPPAPYLPRCYVDE